MTPFPSAFSKTFAVPPTGIDLSKLDAERVPQHIAVIMDGNGRWATGRGLKRLAGHKAGVSAVRELITAANDIGVRYLTIYSFSTENWNRSDEEVSGLMKLFAEVLGKEIAGLSERGVRLKTIGDLGPLPTVTRTVFQDAERDTAANTGMTLVVAVNYGSRAEIVHAVRGIAAEVAAGERTVDSIDESAIESHLYTACMPDPELVIRTSGEVRLSNFLLWQLAYSELWITDKLWPEFTRWDLVEAILDYSGRDRRFGGAKA